MFYIMPFMVRSVICPSGQQEGGPHHTMSNISPVARCHPSHTHTLHNARRLLRQFQCTLLHHASYCLCHWGNISEVTNPRVMGKWLWLFVNSCEYKNPISIETEFLNSAKMGQTHQCAYRIWWKIMTLQWNKWAALKFAVTLLLIF